MRESEVKTICTLKTSYHRTSTAEPVLVLGLGLYLSLCMHGIRDVN